MRLNMARTLVNKPDLLFLDEPSSGLDPVHAAAIRRVIAAQADSGRTVFLTTHDMATAEQLCDRVAFVLNGQIVAIDTPRNFKLAHGHRGVVVEYRTDDGLARHEFDADGFGSDATFLDLVGRGMVETIHTREASLDEVFIAVTGGTL